MAERLWYWSPENNADVVRLYDGVIYVGKWIYSEKAFHYYLSDTDSYGYPKPLPEGCPSPPDLPTPAGNVGDGSFYGRDPGVPADPTDKGDHEVSSSWTDIFKTKTFWASLGLLLAALVAGGQTVAVDGKPPDFNAIATALFAFISIFQRMGTLKAEQAAKG